MPYWHVSSFFQLGGIPVPWIPWQPVPAGEGWLQALQWVWCPPPSVPVREAYPWHAVAPTGLLHHGQQVRLREGEKEEERKRGRGAEEEGKGERCTLNGLWSNSEGMGEDLDVPLKSETTPQWKDQLDHPPFLSVSIFLFLPYGLSFAFPPFLPFFSPSLHSPPVLWDTKEETRHLSLFNTRFSAQGIMHHGKLSSYSPLTPVFLPLCIAHPLCCTESWPSFQ